MKYEVRGTKYEVRNLKYEIAKDFTLKAKEI